MDAFIINGNLSHMSKDFKNAEACYQKALALSPVNVDKATILPNKTRKASAFMPEMDSVQTPKAVLSF
jgi:hypothetical protein